ncbi:hypothetical protein BHE82_02825 [Rice orange leaf phytoplasma]|nr:hypothetical protein BHE82_02825 [Rice orange leaf phytoplasma]
MHKKVPKNQFFSKKALFAVVFLVKYFILKKQMEFKMYNEGMFDASSGMMTGLIVFLVALAVFFIVLFLQMGI